MAIDGGTIVLDVIADARGVPGQVERDVARRGGGRFSRIGSALGGKMLAGFATVFAGQKIVQFFGGAVEAASDLNEAVSAVDQVFGKAGGAVQKFAKTSARDLGLPRKEALEGARAFGAMLVPMEGISSKTGAEMSTRLVTLAGDMASFNNEDPSEMLEKLRSGLSGEAEPLRRFGVRLSAARIEQEALNMGLVQSGEDLTDAAKAQAAYSIILKDTELQQGDFARTSDGLANQQRILSAQWTDMKATLGQALLPAITSVVTWFNDKLVPGLTRGADTVSKLSKRFGDLRSPIDTIRNLIGGGKGGGGNSLLKAFQVLGGDDGAQGFGEIMDNLLGNSGRWVGMFRGIGNVVRELHDVWRDAWPQIRAIAVGALQVVRETVRAVLNYIEGVWQRNGRNLINHARGIWGGIRQVINGALMVIRGIVDVALGALTGDWRRAWDGIKRILAGVWNVMQGVVRAAISTVRAVLGQVMAAIQTLWSGAWTRVRHSLASAWESIKTAIRNGTTNVRTTISDMLDRVRNYFADVWDRIITRARGFVVSLVIAIVGMQNTIIRGLTGFRDKMYDLGSAIFRRFADGIRSAISTVKNAVGGIVSLFSGGGGSGDGLGAIGTRVQEMIAQARAQHAAYSGASTSGLLPHLKAAARTIAGFGGRVSSGFRPGAITATGNRSYHGMGRAIDLVPPTMSLFNKIRATFPGATELIYSPAGNRQLWHGRPHYYSGVTRANHWDHIHLALRQGGQIPGWDPTGADDVIARLTRGEWIMPTDAVRKYGPGFMRDVQTGRLPAFKTGGLIQATRAILARIRSGRSIFEDLTWRGAPQVVKDRNEAVVAGIRQFLPRKWNFTGGAKSTRLLRQALERYLAKRERIARERAVTRSSRLMSGRQVAAVTNEAARKAASNTMKAAKAAGDGPGAGSAASAGDTGGGGGLQPGRYDIRLIVGEHEMDAYLRIRERGQQRDTKAMTKAGW